MAKPKFLSLGWALIDWIETFCVHGPGDVEGQPVELDDEFAAFILKAYAVNPDGSRRKRRGVISRPKGRAKSELAAFLGIAEALGPVRFHHFAKRGEVSAWGYRYSPGEPVGVPVRRPEILCFATELGQAGNTYDAIRYMLDPETCAPALLDTYGRIDVGLTRINIPGGGTITPEAAADSSADGRKTTFAVCDESHLWTLPRMKRLHQVVLRNLLKRKIASGWMLETTTMFAPGEGSVAEGTFEFARAIAEGRASDLGLLFDHREAPAKFDVRKPKDRLAGLKWVYGPAAAWMDLQAIADSYDDPQTSSAEWERYWFNRPRSLQGQWLSQLDWDLCNAGVPIPDGAAIVLGLDASLSDDSTALVAVSVEEMPHVHLVGLWERPPNASDWTVDIGAVEEAVRLAAMRWKVLEVACDPFVLNRSMEVLAADGLPVTEFRQSAQRMTPATQRVTALVRTHQMRHDGDARLARHVSNAVLREDSRGVRLVKEQPRSPRKIDAAVAMVMAVDRAQWHRDNNVDYDVMDSIL